jgi:hypothetical protein
MAAKSFFNVPTEKLSPRQLEPRQDNLEVVKGFRGQGVHNMFFYQKCYQHNFSPGSLQPVPTITINFAVFNFIPEKSKHQSYMKTLICTNIKMTFTLTARLSLKATAAKLDFAACFRYAKCWFRVRLHKKLFFDFDDFMMIFIQSRMVHFATK